MSNYTILSPDGFSISPEQYTKLKKLHKKMVQSYDPYALDFTEYNEYKNKILKSIEKYGYFHQCNNFCILESWHYKYLF